MNKKVVLLILDGWGIAKPDKFNAILNAKTPNMDRLMSEYPNIQLQTFGHHVGLPDGQMGTSEVNHMAIGLGRIVWQTLPRVTKDFETGEMNKNEQIQNLINHIVQNNSGLHIETILSDGGIHTHIEHLFLFLELLKSNNFKQKVFLHIFTDGRDSAPKSAIRYLDMLEERLGDYPFVSIGTLQGRFYLDRDRDWDKTEIAFQLMRNLKGKVVKSWKEAIDEAYTYTDNDQYIKQYVLNKDSAIKEGDGFISLHFRTDRLHQLIERILKEKIGNFYLTAFVRPSEKFEMKPVMKSESKENSLAKVLSDNGKSQIHLTETEKFTHLTYFFNGEAEKELPNEKWVLDESNRFVKPNYNFEPTMRAFKLTKQILEAIEEDKTDFIVVNYPNTDMVGHTGNYEAAVIASESVDYCIGKLMEVLENKLDDYAIFITADHGNSDEMWDYEANQPHTRHTLNPVPLILITKEKLKLMNEDSLQNIAPTILELMGVPIPKEMGGKSILVK